MKNSIIKSRYAIIALIMMAIYGVGAFASSPWTVNPSDYRYDMSLYLDVTFGNSKMDYSQNSVAVFCGDECRGVAEVLPLGDGRECLYLRARSNQESGETMTFKYYNDATQEIKSIEDVSFPFESNGRLGYPSDPYMVKITKYFDVALSAGDGGSIDKEGGRLEEGSELKVTASPSEGYHFERWSDGVTDNPRTIIVDADLSLTAEFAISSYKLSYMVDGSLYKEYTLDFGSAITAEAEPQKEGYTFSGWDNVPATMPAHDVTVNGTFSGNSYNVVFKIDGDVFKSESVEIGKAITTPEAPAKEGYTFSGWQNIPEVMPAHDLEILGSYTVNSYKLVYKVDGSDYKEYTLDFGSAITSEAEPQKEGYTFSGWDTVPATMPARDVIVNGTFKINTYKLNIYLNDELYKTELIEFGSTIQIADPKVPEGKKFDGWKEDIPTAMPSHDVDIHGTYSDIASIEDVRIDDDASVTVCKINGTILFRNVRWADVESKLDSGLYIINGKKYILTR